MSKIKKIPFAPPDVTEADIEAVVKTLRSGWITTGPVTAEFESEICGYTGAEACLCMNSGTAAMELALRFLGVGEGDEVITTPYTYAATANVIVHTGARPVFVDVAPGSFNIDPRKIAEAITERTKAVMPVDIAGWPCDYDEIVEAVNAAKALYRPDPDTPQTWFDRIPILADSAHSFGAAYKGRMLGSVADFTAFSFHAVKNLTTSEGGALVLRPMGSRDMRAVYDQLRVLSLHGQNKDAFKKFNSSAWEYEIVSAGFKWNMTDISAALGLSQLARYDSDILPGRRRVFQSYREYLSDDRFLHPLAENAEKRSSCHVYNLRIPDAAGERRNAIIEKMFDRGISTNVHFKPLPLHPYYAGRGYNMCDYPIAHEMYLSEISLPVYPQLTDDDVLYVAEAMRSVTKEVLG
ncbi:MAG: DegT/DnrJ/EryC1/StrS family aminotransferase [Verrucomicrobia bacterium]|nr:DegT/DnrJ/EryC1/StrS family aminotransferase [Verrucomicrobiota bacterium]